MMTSLFKKQKRSLRLSSKGTLNRGSTPIRNGLTPVTSVSLPTKKAPSCITARGRFRGSTSYHMILTNHASASSNKLCAITGFPGPFFDDQLTVVIQKASPCPSHYRTLPGEEDLPTSLLFVVYLLFSMLTGKQVNVNTFSQKIKI